MLHRFLSILAIVSFCFAHEAKAQDRVHVDSNYKKFRCGPGPVAGVIILEVYGVGFSYIASKHRGMETRSWAGYMLLRQLQSLA